MSNEDPEPIQEQISQTRSIGFILLGGVAIAAIVFVVILFMGTGRDDVQRNYVEDPSATGLNAQGAAETGLPEEGSGPETTISGGETPSSTPQPGMTNN